MSNIEDAANKTVARSERESTTKQCLRCGAAVLAANIAGPEAHSRTNRPCGCHAPVGEVETQSLVFEIECVECGIERRVEDNEQAVRELAEIHKEELGHDVTVEEDEDDE